MNTVLMHFRDFTKYSTSQIKSQSHDKPPEQLNLSEKKLIIEQSMDRYFLFFFLSTTTPTLIKAIITATIERGVLLPLPEPGAPTVIVPPIP